MSLDGSYLSEATHAQLELFYSLPPDVQAKVYCDEFSIEEVRDSRNYRCKSSLIEAVLRFSLYGFFSLRWLHRGVRALPPARHVLEVQGGTIVAWHGARAAGGHCPLQPGCRDNDEDGIEAHMDWCAVESDYDELSEYAR
jgi:hypothetical protein